MDDSCMECRLPYTVECHLTDERYCDAHWIMEMHKRFTAMLEQGDVLGDDYDPCWTEALTIIAMDVVDALGRLDRVKAYERADFIDAMRADEQYAQAQLERWVQDDEAQVQG